MNKQMYKKKEIGNNDADFTIYLIQSKNHCMTAIPKKPEYHIDKVKLERKSKELQTALIKLMNNQDKLLDKTHNNIKGNNSDNSIYIGR